MALTDKAGWLLARMQESRSGKFGYLLSEADIYEPFVAELETSGLAARKRCGGYPGMQITDAGRRHRA